VMAAAWSLISRRMSNSTTPISCSVTSIPWP